MKALRTGEIVPASSLALWNVSPEQTNLLIQSGRIAAAFTSVSKWSTNNGMLAELEFQVQPGFTVQPAWPLRVSNVEMSINGFDTVDLGNETLTLISRAPVAPKFTADVIVSENAIQLDVETEI